MNNAENTKNGFSLIEHVRQTVNDDVRLFLAPFVGAVKGVKDELDQIKARKSASQKR